ncbi:hypothetical protein [Mycobacterium arosiense]|uniref:hypothetical protein n=1 Tax=Mycobacterium arosiense TaxID=425468 RepID=UPI0011542764|nr:hypothetical protein [Mycobacterium arosiense]
MAKPTAGTEVGEQDEAQSEFDHTEPGSDTADNPSKNSDTHDAVPETGDSSTNTASVGDVAVGETAKPNPAKQTENTGSERRQISVSIRSLLTALLICALLVGIGVLSWLYVGATAKLNQEARQSSDSAHAERIALDYAVDAAKINFQDLKSWNTNLVKGTTPELKEKLNSAAKSMEQILEPLQWNSTAVPLAAKVRSESNGVFVVDTFVGVDTKTVQAQEGLRSTATYSITIDSKHDWQISEVGGIGSVIGQK